MKNFLNFINFLWITLNYAYTYHGDLPSFRRPKAKMWKDRRDDLHRQALLLLKRLILRLSIISVISIDEICCGFRRWQQHKKKKINDKQWTKYFASIWGIRKYYLETNYSRNECSILIFFMIRDIHTCTHINTWPRHNW